MEENPQQDRDEDEAADTGADDAHASAEPGDIENDPSHNPPIEGLKDLKGG